MSREEAKEKIRDLGAVFHSDVNEDLSYLIVGNEPGSKLDKAKKLGIKIINEDKFLNLINLTK
jgi:DNA ligase (NAD+)